MYAWFYQQSTVLFLPILAMLVFMVVFSASVVRAWALYRNASDNVNHMSMLPLKDEDRTVPANAPVTRGGSHV